MNVTVGRKYKGEKRMKNCLTIREHEAFTLILCGNDNNELPEKWIYLRTAYELC